MKRPIIQPENSSNYLIFFDLSSQNVNLHRGAVGTQNKKQCHKNSRFHKVE